MTLAAPSTRLDLLVAARIVGRELGTSKALARNGGLYFELEPGSAWLLGLFPDSAGRVRVVAFYGATEVATLWSRARDLGRLAALAQDLRSEVATLVA